MLQRRFWMRGGGSGLAALAALLTTLCCLGLPALVGLISALGAGFLLNDRYLEPSLSGTLLLTVLVAGLHLRRHHQPGPFLLSLVAAGSVFFALYGTTVLPHASGGDHMADGMAATPGWSPYLVYTGAGIYFVVALALGAWFLFGPKRGKREMDAACPACAPVASETHVQERSPIPEDLPATRREALR